MQRKEYEPANSYVYRAGVKADAPAEEQALAVSSFLQPRPAGSSISNSGQYGYQYFQLQKDKPGEAAATR